MRKNVIAILALLILVGWGLYDYSSRSLQQAGSDNSQQDLANVEIGTQKGQKAPDFALLNLDQQTVRLSDFAGNKVILNFWATWCPPCRAEMPHMEKFYSDYGEDVVVLAVNLTHTERQVSDVPAFVDEFALTFPIVMDVEGEVTSQYQVFAYPTTYMIDSQGIIQEVYMGPIDYTIMQEVTSRMN